MQMKGTMLSFVYENLHKSLPPYIIHPLNYSWIVAMQLPNLSFVFSIWSSHQVWTTFLLYWTTLFPLRVTAGRKVNVWSNEPSTEGHAVQSFSPKYASDMENTVRLKPGIYKVLCIFHKRKLYIDYNLSKMYLCGYQIP